MKKILITFLIGFLLGTAGGAIGTFWYFTKTAEEVAEVIKPADVDLPVAEIREKLLHGSFREKLAARKQIGKLEPDQRYAVLEVLAKDDEQLARLTAVGELGKMMKELGYKGARHLLQSLASNDADAQVRETAAELLGKPPAEGARP